MNFNTSANYDLIYAPIRVVGEKKPEQSTKTRLTHPFFGVQPMFASKSQGIALQYRYIPSTESNTQRNSLELRQFVALEEPPLDALPHGHFGVFSTLAEAEDAMFDHICAVIPLTNANSLHISDVHAALAILIGRQASLIATRTRRGLGNVIVISRKMYEILVKSHSDIFAAKTECLSSLYHKDNKILLEERSNLIFVEMLNRNAKVFVHRDWADDHPAVIGYRGVSEVDAGSFLMPHHTGQGYTIVLNQSDDPQTPINWIDYYGVVGIK